MSDIKIKTKKILLIDGHPSQDSFCDVLSSEYVKGAESRRHEIIRLNLRDLNFDPILRYGYSKVKVQNLEEDLIKSQNLIKDCDHLVIVSPVWWGAPPALLKGFLDRVLLSGFAYRFNPTTGLPIKLLKGRTATVIYTQGVSKFLSLFTKDSFWPMMNCNVLWFCGFSNIKRYRVYSAKNIDNDRTKKILQDIYKIGQSGS